MKILYDCDNTMGVPNRDVDDALALLYLLGRDDVELLGITATHGNDTVDTVFKATAGLLGDIGREDVPLLRGGAKDNRVSEASRFLAAQAALHRGEVTMLATGALTNLCGAWESDRSFFSNLNRVVLMGGITGPLVINNVQCNELNFSCDPEASHKVLGSGADVTVITGHLCLAVPFAGPEFSILEGKGGPPVFHYLFERLGPWRELMRKVFKIDGFYNWDVVAAVCATDPEIFEDRTVLVDSGPGELATGLLRVASNDGYRVNVPERIVKPGAIANLLFDSLKRVSLIPSLLPPGHDQERV